MSIVIPTYISQIEPYQGGKPIKEVAREIGIAEERIIKLASNENPLGISEKAKIAINGALNDVARYPDGNGYYLKQAISNKFSIKSNQIILGNGSNDILELAARTVLSVGDEVIFSEYAFAVYKIVTKAVGAIGIEAPTNHYAHNLENFLKLITGRTKLIFIANPNNPTGTLINKLALEKFFFKVPSHILIVLDEAYDEYLSDDLKSNAFCWLNKYKNLLISRSFSKAYGLAGLRIGYGVGSSKLIELMNRVRQPFNVNYLAQIAATESLKDDYFIEESRKINNQGMKQITDVFKSLFIDYIPSFGNFVSFKLQDEKCAIMYYQHLLKNGVIVRPIANYKLPQFLRVSIGLEEENNIFIDHLSNCNI
ncbi:MAG: histidinol-phosphate transaminase [Methylophilaceae bacterium]